MSLHFNRLFYFVIIRQMSSGANLKNRLPNSPHEPLLQLAPNAWIYEVTGV
jgi:hypothetical protein